EALRYAIDETDAIVNLAGEPIAGGRWTAARKREIRDSRVHTTRQLIEALAAASRRPTVLVNASAIGYYGAHRDEPLDASARPRPGFPGRRLPGLGGGGAARRAPGRARGVPAPRHRARARRRRSHAHAASLPRLHGRPRRQRPPVDVVDPPGRRDRTGDRGAR